MTARDSDLTKELETVIRVVLNEELLIMMSQLELLEVTSRALLPFGHWCTSIFCSVLAGTGKYIVYKASSIFSKYSRRPLFEKYISLGSERGTFLVEQTTFVCQLLRSADLFVHWSVQ
jgi:hypothetical protein